MDRNLIRVRGNTTISIFITNATVKYLTLVAIYTSHFQNKVCSKRFPFLERVKKRIFMVTFFYHKLSWKNLCKVSRFVRHILKYSNVFLNPIDVCFTLFFSLLLQEYTSVNSETSLNTLYGNNSSFFLQKHKPHLGLWLKKTVWLIVAYFFLLWGCILNLCRRPLSKLHELLDKKFIFKVTWIIFRGEKTMENKDCSSSTL